MVRVSPPPPFQTPRPRFIEIPAGERLARIFDPTRHGTTALTFRRNGPRLRFDHHRGAGSHRDPADDPERAVYYAAWDADVRVALASCLVEVFGDTGIVAPGDLMLALPTTTRPLRLLDLRASAAMLAGTVAAIASCEHRLAQPWSRYFYEETGVFGPIDGLLYANAHNSGPALMLYERAEDALACPEQDVIRLDAPDLRPAINRVMIDHNNLSY